MSHTRRGYLRKPAETPASEPRRLPDGCLRIVIPAALASGALRAEETAELIAYLTASALDPDGTGRVTVDRLARELAQVVSKRRLRDMLKGEKLARYLAADGDTFQLHGKARIVASFDGEVLPRSDAIGFPLSVLNNRPRRGAALLAAVLATGRGRPRSYCFISRFTAVDRGTIYEWLRDPLVSQYMLRRSPTWLRTNRRKRANRWIVPAWREGGSLQVKRGLGSRQGGAEQPPRGIRPFPRLYYDNEADMLRDFRALRRQGIDVARELYKRGELLIGNGRELQPYYPEQVLELLGIRAAGLPHYYWDTDQEEEYYTNH